LFANLISEYCLAEVSMFVRTDDLNNAFGDLGHPFRHPYFFLLYHLISEFAANQHKIGLDEPIDWIFDRQVMLETKVQAEWEVFQAATVTPKRLIGEMPVFKNDEEFLPLQSADMLAWRVLKSVELGEDPLKHLFIGEGKLELPWLSFGWPKESLASKRRAMERPRISGTFGDWPFFCDF
jgi:hypothetical protein